jgi:hypothetical protein
LISSGQGRPLAINADDCEVRPLSSTDFRGYNSNPDLFIAYVQICSLLGQLTQCCCRQSLTRRTRQSIETALYHWIQDLPGSLRLFRNAAISEASSTENIQSPYNFEARQLHIPYFIILVILFRPSAVGSRPSSVATLASSSVAKLFEDFLARDEIRFLGPIFTFYLLAAGGSLLSCRRLPHLWENRAQKDMQTIQVSLKELAKQWPSATGSLRALQGIADEVAKMPQEDTMLPLTTLSNDEKSFFSMFGPSLSWAWDDLIAGQHSRGVSGSQCQRTESEIMTAGILAELRTPIASPAAVDDHQQLSTFLEHQPDDLMHSQYDGVGNWLLKDWDWSIEVPW